MRRRKTAETIKELPVADEKITGAEKSVFFTIICRINLFLFLCIITNMVVYAVGNYRLFLDSILIVMSKFNAIFSNIAFMFGIVSIGIAIGFGIKFNKKFLFYIIPFFFLSVLSFLLMYLQVILNYLVS